MATPLIAPKTIIGDPNDNTRQLAVNADGSLNINVATAATQVSKTVTTTVTRPADTDPYVANDVWANSTTAPTAGGFSFANAAPQSGGTGKITDLIVINSQAASLQGELWIFDSAVTAVNDNAAFALSDADALKLVAVIPFTTEAQPSNAVAVISNINELFTAVGTANLRFLVKVKAAYTPISGETLTFRLKVEQVN